MRPLNSFRRSRTLTARLLFFHSITLIGLLLILGLALERVLERYFVAQLTDSLTSQARAVQRALEDPASLQGQVIRLGQAIGARVTVIRTDGVVLADSEDNPAAMANHRSRPEVREALGGRVGVSSRVSATVGTAFRYVALPPSAGRIIRVALPLTTVDSELRTIRLMLTGGFGLAAVVGLLVLGLIAQRLLRPLRDITGAVARAGELDGAAPVPERGTEELVVLAATVNRMRRELEQRILALKEEQRTRDAILSALEEGVVLVDDDGQVVYRNDRAEELSATPKDHGLTLPHPLRSLVATSRDKASTVISEFSMPGDRTIQALAVPVREAEALVVLRDVSETRRVESVRREFVANASHELKTPVASIRALAETIGDSARADPAATSRFVGQLEREALRLSQIVSDLLDLSRLESDMGPRTDVDVARIVADEVNRQRERAKAARVSLDFSPEADDVVVAGSGADMALLVRNLLDNALRYTLDGGKVEVSLGCLDGEAVLAVRDNGIGIPSRDQERIFERFYRVDRARSRETGGTGLGLSIVKHVAENHGGSVSVESELGRGSMFTVRLPTVQPKASAS